MKATPEGEVSMDLLQAAARDHIPVNPSAKKALPANDSLNLIIPEPKDRPSIDDILLEIQQQQWYKNQIADRRTFEEKVAIEGSKALCGCFLCLTTRTQDSWPSLFHIPYNKHCESREI
jgi:DEAD/DEAH box helicase domain-containing protein